MPSILVVCTGNICRSPMAEGFLRSALLRRLGPDAPPVASVGVIARDGAAAEPGAVRAAAERDVDIADHVARRLRREHIEAADLIVAMAREHRAALVEAAPGAAGRIFTLKELVRLLEALPASREPGGATERLRSRVSRADALRRQGFRGAARDQDVDDPLGMPLEVYGAVAQELDTWCERLVEGLFGHALERADARAGSA